MKTNKTKKTQVYKTKLKKNDAVRIIAGAHKNKDVQILEINKKTNRAKIKGVSVIKHQKATQDGQKGGIVELDAWIHLSNLALLDPNKKNEITKIGFKIINNKKFRYGKNSQKIIKK